MNLLVALPVVLPLLAAGLSIALRRYLWAQRSLSTMVLVAVLTTADRKSVV